MTRKINRQIIIENNSIIAEFLGGVIESIAIINSKEIKAWKGDIATQ